ncbi:hypothetical protein J437_LFUL007338 [Ladona fulva]|uniref:ATP-dependent DNA helicase n=1 Tax=Ladona fulva TaxID=123851 RepID=A0A8K0KKY7_LADFU|nr:hypothetical protein J437_LFUL007338 [Ladona fulva]
MQSVNNRVGEIFFLDAPVGTGKTFLIRLILIAHSALKLPLNMHSCSFIETPMCNISKASGMGKVLQKCKLVVWDECTMAHKKIA